MVSLKAFDQGSDMLRTMFGSYHVKNVLERQQKVEKTIESHLGKRQKEWKRRTFKNLLSLSLYVWHH